MGAPLINSMTGFGSAEGAYEGCSWTWEVKSVNGKGLDLRWRFPQGFDGFDAEVRKRLSARFKRGNFSINLNLIRPEAALRYRVNEEMMDQLMPVIASLKEKLPEVQAPALDGLMNLKGLIEAEEEEETPEFREGLEAALLETLGVAIGALDQSRAAEGDKLNSILEDRLAHMDRLVKAAEANAALLPEKIRERLKAQVEDLLGQAPGLPEERLAQEAAVLMVKADLREEVDRLKAHVETARELLADKEAVGRRFDFLCQEFNREANTLCSKSSDSELTKIGMDLKVTIDQIREQIQNVE